MSEDIAMRTWAGLNSFSVSGVQRSEATTKPLRIFGGNDFMPGPEASCNDVSRTREGKIGGKQGRIEWI